MPADLICPKCRGAMRNHERNRVTIDQCVECRGSSWTAAS
ncbi:zf-TFIIB domain-containing protein [Kineosporia sp. R_H_3]